MSPRSSSPNPQRISSLEALAQRRRRRPSRIVGAICTARCAGADCGVFAAPKPLWGQMTEGLLKRCGQIASGRSPLTTSSCRCAVEVGGLWGEIRRRPPPRHRRPQVSATPRDKTKEARPPPRKCQKPPSCTVNRKGHSCTVSWEVRRRQSLCGCHILAHPFSTTPPRRPELRASVAPGPPDFGRRCAPLNPGLWRGARASARVRGRRPRAGAAPITDRVGQRPMAGA